MYLTQKNHIRKDKETYKILKTLTRLSKNLYNTTLYTIKQYYELYNSFLHYESAYHLVKSNENYQMLPSQVAQQTMKTVNQAFKSYFKLLKKDYKDKLNIPNYLPKDGYFLLIFTKNMYKIEEYEIRLSLGREFTKKYGIRYLYFAIPPNIKDKKIKEVRIIPKYDGLYFEIEFVYLKEPENPELDKENYLSIDLGLNNFATCITTHGTSFIIEGKGIKSYNRWWNKIKAKLQSIYTKQKCKKGKKLGPL